MANIIFDESSLRDTADALIVINPRGHTSADGILEHMKCTAIRQQEREPGYLGYLSTGGFELCFWRDEQGEMNVRASVMAYTVLRYLKEKT